MSKNDFEILRQQIIRSERGRNAGVDTQNGPLIALNVKQLFKSWLMIALKQWRKTDPETPVAMRNALDAVEAGVYELKTLESKIDLLPQLPLEMAAILSSLLPEKNYPFKALAHTNGVQSNAEAALDLLLAESILEGTTPSPRNLEQTIQKIQNELTRSIYITYFDILESHTLDLPSDEFVARAHHLYTKRATDSYFINALPFEGGGTENPLVVDFRLGAILHRVGIKQSSIHQWQW